MTCRLYVFLGIIITLFVSSVYSEEIDIIEPVKNVYAHIDTDGILLSSSDSCYFEEFDFLCRPSFATIWKDTAIVKEIAWLYNGDSQQPFQKIETEHKSIREETFDVKGRLVSLELTDSDGLLSEKNVWERDSEDRLVSFIKTKNTLLERIEWSYSEGDFLLEKRIFKGDTLISKSVYSNNDNWIETIFHNSVSILSVKWVDGVRVDDVKK